MRFSFGFNTVSRSIVHGVKSTHSASTSLLLYEVITFITSHSRGATAAKTLCARKRIDHRVLIFSVSRSSAVSFSQDFPASIIEAHGRPALEAIETMSGKRIPGQVWRKLGPVTVAGVGGGGGAKADNRVASLMDQYQQMLKFLKEKGCLLNCLPAEVMHRREFPTLLVFRGVRIVRSCSTSHLW